MTLISSSVIYYEMWDNCGYTITQMTANSPWKAYGSDANCRIRLVSPMEKKIEDKLNYHIEYQVVKMIRKDLERMSEK